MKDSFFGFYHPTSDEYQRLWSEGLIVLDTNVLLDLYRLPTTARDELLKVLESLQERIWIPYQVALEFQRRRLTVIAAERKVTEDALVSAEKLLADLAMRIESLQVEKRGLNLDSTPLIAELRAANEKLVEAIKKVHQSQLDIASSDPVREKLDAILKGRVGPAPKTQADVEKLTQNGSSRFDDKIPPGFADKDKDKNPNEATFIHDHIRYERKFGDLMLWRQLIDHTKAAGAKAVLLVTADRKEDWWWREQGKTIGPHPELVREISREGAVELFWMYSSVQFIEHANKYVKAEVSSQSVAELQNVVQLAGELSAHAEKSVLDIDSGMRANRAVGEVFPADIRDREGIISMIMEWLMESGADVVRNAQGFPDMLLFRNGSVLGVEVRPVRTFEHMLLSPAVINAMLRGYLEMAEHRLSAFTMIVVIPDKDYSMILGERIDKLQHRLSSLLERYPISAIIVGSIIRDRFVPLIQQGGRGEEPWTPIG